MPDLKFKGGKFYFSLLNGGSVTPPPIPNLTNPSLDPPGIIELLQGELGITEKIMEPILAPIIQQFTSSNLVASSFVGDSSLEEVNPDALTSSIVSNYVPDNTGIKALEKTIIQGMMESFKPLMDFAKIFIEFLAIAEDVFCMFLGTSIKILGKEIGFPSRNPRYWEKSLNYAQTINFQKRKINEVMDEGLDAFNQRMSDENPIKDNIPNGNGDRKIGKDDREAIYVGYFDNDGRAVSPPKWVKESNKWYRKDVTQENGNVITIGSPFEQLSINFKEGTEELRARLLASLSDIDKQKEKMIGEIQNKKRDLQRRNVDNDTLQQEYKSIDSEKQEANKQFDELKLALLDTIDGTNKAGFNLINDENPNEGVQPPGVVNEWISKTRSSQLRTKYFPEQVSTVQQLVDRKNKPVEPYVSIPKVNTTYRGRNVSVEVPLAYEEQISQKEVRGKNVFFDKRRRKGLKFYSNKNVVESFNLLQGTDKNTPYADNKKTYFSHDKDSDDAEYVPDPVKNYTLPLEWNEILEYEVRDTATEKVIRTEREVIPHKLDIENDYELRLIKVINVPLKGKDSNGVPILNDDFFGKYVTEDGVKTFKNSDAYNLLRDNIRKGRINVRDNVKTLYTSGNNIPEKLRTNPDTGLSFDGNLHSTPDININNDLKEGVIYHGLDPRFADPNRYKVFWLVEALKKDERGIAPINKKFNYKDEKFAEENSTTTANEDDGKEWYGLLDKFLAIPRIFSGMLPVLITQLIPVIIKIIELISNPTKIASFLLELGLTNEAISKFPQNFKDYSSTGTFGKAQELGNVDVPETLEEQAANPNPTDPNIHTGLQVGVDNPSPISLIDGQASIEFGKAAFGNPIIEFGINLVAASSTPFKFITKRKEREDFDSAPAVRDQPLFSMILSFIKLPFEILFKIFMWIINWIKKMLNPAKIPAAMIEFLSFKWLFEILSPTCIFDVLGIPEGTPNDLLQEFSNLDDTTGDEAQKLVNKVVDSLKGGSDDYIEVLIYQYFKNEQFIREEVVERPYYNNTNNDNNNNDDNNNVNNGDEDFNSQARSGAGLGGSATLEVPDVLDFCGERNFNLNSILPLPFWSEFPPLNACEKPILFLKPLEMIFGNLSFIQGLINGLISMPTSILGVEPTFRLPRLGEEIPFANILGDLIDKLKAQYEQITPE